MSEKSAWSVLLAEFRTIEVLVDLRGVDQSREGKEPLGYTLTCKAG